MIKIGETVRDYQHTIHSKLMLMLMSFGQEKQTTYRILNTIMPY